MERAVVFIRVPPFLPGHGAFATCDPKPPEGSFRDVEIFEVYFYFWPLEDAEVWRLIHTHAS